MPFLRFLQITIIWSINYAYFVGTSYVESDLGTVISANLLFRHGHRTPINCYFTDPYKDESYWQEGWGQLTNIGKMQHYELGKWIRKRYKHLLNETYSRDEINILSTDVDRTLMSAEANLAGIYPPKGSQEWNENINWQPIPVHTVPTNLDKVLSMDAPCPRYSSEYNKVFSLPAVIDLLASYQGLFDYLTKHTGDSVKTLQSVQNIWSTMFIETLRNYTLPEWAYKVYPNPMAIAGANDYVLQTYTDSLKRLKSGPLLKDMLSHFKLKLEGKRADDSNEIVEKKKKVVWVYSGHDETIATLLNSLGIFNLINPPFASLVLIELRNINDDHYITVSYHNSSTQPPYLLGIPGCSNICPYNKFIELTSNIIPYDWDVECHSINLFDITNELPYNTISVFAILTSTVLLLLLLASLSLFWKKRPTRTYRKLKTDSI